LRRKEKEFKDSEPVQKKRITGQIPNSSQEINETESRFKVSEDFDSNHKLKLR